MSTIVWSLVIAAAGMYGIPVHVRVQFETEAECERARATVTSSRKPETRCEPQKKATP